MHSPNTLLQCSVRSQAPLVNLLNVDQIKKRVSLIFIFT